MHSIPEGWDFCGWVTKNDVLCTDGRTIKRDAFAHQSGTSVPLIWMHNHNDPACVLGHLFLENRPEGVFGYAYCNDTDNGNRAREMVAHGDINAFSIFATNLREKMRDVIHGVIKEASLVLSGANEGAKIIDHAFAHSDDGIDELEAFYLPGPEVSNLTMSEVELAHADQEESKTKPDEKTVQDVYDKMSDEQKLVCAFLIESAVTEALAGTEEESEGSEDEPADKGDESSMSHSDDVIEIQNEEEGDNEMYNMFDKENNSEVMVHSELNSLLVRARDTKQSSLKEYIAENTDSLAHADDYGHGVEVGTGNATYGFNDPNMLFPDYKAVNNTPDFITRNMEWVNIFMAGTQHLPFSRIKSVHANLTEAQARAKGYITGTQKVSQVFSLLKRKTDPQTVYKLQKMERDDIIDITDFDVVAWIKTEMRMMLNEELAGAALFGDGREPTDDDKISEDHIRPVWGDATLYAIAEHITRGEKTDSEIAKEVLTRVVKSRKKYKGSGNLVAFVTEDLIAEWELMEDKMGRPLFNSIDDVAKKLRVNRIVPVPTMSERVRDGKTPLFIALSLRDYKFGADKGGSVNLFDDFDIDFNRYTWLIETRASGALAKPFSAITVDIDAVVTDTDTPSETPTPEEGTDGEG